MAGRRAIAPRPAGITIERDDDRLIATRIHLVVAAIRESWQAEKSIVSV